MVHFTACKNEPKMKPSRVQSEADVPLDMWVNRLAITLAALGILALAIASLFLLATPFMNGSGDTVACLLTTTVFVAAALLLLFMWAVLYMLQKLGSNTSNASGQNESIKEPS